MLRSALFASLIACLCLSATTGAAEHNRLTDEELADGWVLLFDGETFFGWRKVADCDWEIVDGSIVVSKGEVGLLRTTTQYGNYTLKADFRSAKGTNSGIFLRTPPEPKAPAKDCYELNIADAGTSKFPTGSFVDRLEATGEDNDSQEWQSYEVTVDGEHLIVKLDGNVVAAYDDPNPLGRGFIGLQHNSGQVEFRNIKLKPLGGKSLFNGKDLSGWKTYPDMPSVFSVTPKGELNVKNGRGQLESVEKFGDFVLQLECFSNGELLNSGVFFRCIPGDQMMGYECQIQNGYIDDDRTQPNACATGGFFRQQDARRVMADDFTWFHLTLVAEGPHIAAWVNGVQVSDWTDKRKADKNPRKGLRTDPGTLMIQGHDPTTDLSFRNLRAAEIPRRWGK